jgi:DNA (cytosine-5)-methyltransferase 1
MNMRVLTSIELCAGAGGQAIGLEAAGFHHSALVEIDKHACATLRHNRPQWNVIEDDIAKFNGRPYRGVDLLAAGLPCPPFSVAGKQLGSADERNLFPDALRIIGEAKPKAVLIENVRGFLDAVFEDYRNSLKKQLSDLGYECEWRLLNASDFGVPQLRPRVAFIGIRRDLFKSFHWPEPSLNRPKTVGEVLYPLMASGGWKGAKLWKQRADEIAPTLVGGSKKHGGPDLGPTRARRAWANLSVDGLGIADEPPGPEFVGMPKLTVPMVALLQSFPPDWKIVGKKTNAYRQIGNAFPMLVAKALGEQIHKCLSAAERQTKAS